MFTVCTIYVKVTLAMLVQEIKNIILSRHPSLRCIYKQHIHQSIATKIYLNKQYSLKQISLVQLLKIHTRMSTTFKATNNYNMWRCKCEVGTKHIDPALCIYIGAHLICIDNKHLKDNDPWGNGTICSVIGVKLKTNPISYTWKNYYRKKV